MQYRKVTFLFLMIFLSNIWISFGSASSEWSMTDPEVPLAYVSTHNIYSASLQSPSSSDSKNVILHNLIITYNTFAHLSHNLSLTIQSLRNTNYTGIISVLYSYKQFVLNYSFDILLLPYENRSYIISPEILPHTANMGDNIKFAYISYISTGVVYLTSYDSPFWQYKYSITFGLSMLENINLISSQHQPITFQYHTSNTLLNDGDTIPDAIYKINTPIEQSFFNAPLIECYSNFHTICNKILPYPLSYLMTNFSLEDNELFNSALIQPIFPLYFPVSFPYENFILTFNTMQEYLHDYEKTNSSDYTVLCDFFSTLCSITYNESDHILTVKINENLKWFDGTMENSCKAFEVQWNTESGQLIKYQLRTYTSSVLQEYILQLQSETQKADFSFFIWIGMLILGIGGGVGLILRKKHDQLQDSFGEQITKSQCRDPELCCPNGICED